MVATICSGKYIRWQLPIDRCLAGEWPVYSGNCQRGLWKKREMSEEHMSMVGTVCNGGPISYLHTRAT